MKRGNIGPSNSKLEVVKDNRGDEITTIIHRVESYLNEHYKIRFNSVSLDIELSKINSDIWSSCNENSLWVELQKKGIKIGQNALKSILKSDFVEEYDPFNGYFSSLPKWDMKTDYIEEYANYVILDESESREQFNYHFKKWVVRTVKCALSKSYFNKQAFILTDNGKGQNIGKTTWCRNLCPNSLMDYIAEDIGNLDKDSRILICKNLLINLDELAALSKKEINHLKSLFSKAQVNERLPYASKNTVIPRRASFIGSTNMDTFLQDETGSVRWLCFVVKDINWKYKEDFSIEDLWSQAYYLANSNFVAELTREDIVENELRNEKFQVLSVEREYLEKYFETASSDEGKFLTATDITNTINTNTSLRINNIQVGKALKALKFERKKKNGIAGYYVKHIYP